MAQLAERFRRWIVAPLTSVRVRHCSPAMVVKVKHDIYGETELNVSRVIAICPKKKWILFEDVYWPLSDEDFEKIADAWRQLFNR